ncbi:MAG: ribosome small subunit-dependent GTPase A [Candidatus Saccharibacteria bacterium]
MNIEDLGYNSTFESERNRLGLAGFSVARVVSEFKEAYRVRNADGEYLAKITGKQMFEASSREDYPAVGDWVAITVLDGGRAVIHGILPRQTMIARKSGKNETQVIATNIDIAFVVQAVDRDYNLNRFERYFAIAREGGVRPAVILNKTDLLSDAELEEMVAQLHARLGTIDVVLTSTKNDRGLDDLNRFLIGGKTYCFLGSSGVGKSSLINRLLGDSAIKTGEISSYSGRGKHVTTGRQMYFLGNGAIVIDNPGMREVGMTEASHGIDAVFDEITLLSEKCGFADCTHIHEPNCAVLSALETGELDKEKYSNYLTLRKEAEYAGMNSAEKREKDRRFGKFIKKTKRDLKDLGHKDF